MRSKRQQLEIDEDYQFQQKSWKWQRMGFSFCVLLILLGLAGFFGGGPLSKAEAKSGDRALRVEYERFLQRKAPVSLRINANGASTNSGGKLRIWISQDYLKNFEKQHITPEPETIEVSGDRVVLVFPLGEQSGSKRIHIDGQTARAGRIQGRCGVDAGPAVVFEQFSYP